MITKDTKLPEYDELEVPEIELSTPFLKAGCFHLGKYCEAVNNEFMMCRQEEKDPRKCLNVGKAVTACSMKFFQQVKKNCADEFTDYAYCLDKGSIDMSMRKCRNTQAIYDYCMLDKLGMKRPHYGYFSEVKIHESTRAKPLPDPPTHYPDAVPYPLPPEVPRQPAKYASRFFFLH